MKCSAMIVGACICLSGCSFYARGPADYRTAVRKVLEQKQPDVEACYKQSYEKDDSVQGRVVVSFEVEPKTGKIVKPSVVPAGTTANETLQKCVLTGLDGLALDPPDQRTGAATFTWDFSPAASTEHSG
jgi:hypothetical protein